MIIMKDRTKLWKIEEIGEYSLVLSSAEVDPLYDENILLLPNPTTDFIKQYGGHDYSTFLRKFGVDSKETLYTPETLIIYFKDSVPKWAKVGMEVIIKLKPK